MFKIGDFSKFSQVPVKTLRYYDEIGLLPPASVDTSTGYRYYTLDQLPRLHRILAMRDLGFSLEQIARLLADGFSSSHLREMLLLKRAELQEQVREEQARLARVEARLQQIEEEERMTTYEVVVKEAQSQRVVSLRETIPSYRDIGKLIDTVYSHVAQHGQQGGLSAAIWHDPEYRERDVDAEALVLVESALPGDDHIRSYELPAAHVASLVHHGSYATLNNAYAALYDWIEHNDYRFIGPPRELYLHMSSNHEQDLEACITELQVPVEKS